MTFEVQFEQLAPCLKLSNTFVKQTEGDQAFMADAWSKSQTGFEEFVRMSRGGNEYAARCSRALYRRLTETADLSQLILGYLVMPSGHDWYQSLARGVVTDCALGSTRKVDALIAPFLEHLRVFLYATEEQICHHAWRTYLDVVRLPEGQNRRHSWVRQAAVNLPYRGQSILFAPVAGMALILLRMPCSESEIEWVFSHLRRLFGDHARHTRDDLVEARPTIMMNNLDVTHNFVEGPSQMEGDALAAPDRQ
jgi:hypothetical protein